MTPRNIRIIDPAAIRQNMALLREAVPKKAKIMAVVKADGYGHGAVTAAR
ncbi:MAG: alanine racemase, partial [Clostridia bacterium]|nr:alanine racemase [Clostridia bacterium]